MAAPGAGFLSSHLACVGELECLLLGGGRVVMLNCVCSARLSLLWCAFLIACGQVGVRAQLFLSGQNPASTSADLMVTLAWDPCPCPDVNGYFLCWGLASGACTNFLDVGNVTNATIAGLVSNVDYYFTAVSYDVEGNQSLPSSEIRYSPSLANPTVTAWPVASDDHLWPNPGLLHLERWLGELGSAASPSPSLRPSPTLGRLSRA